MKNPLFLGAFAAATIFAGTALAADQAAIPTLAPTAQSAATVAAVRPAMAEVFRPAPTPGDESRSAAHQVADAGPNLHPDLLGLQNRSEGALSDSDIAYDRNQRVRPAGGMSLDIPMQ